MKRLWIIIIVVIVILGFIFIPKILLNKGDEKVAFKILDESNTPEKINKILPNYQEEERALACKVEGKVYVIVTRGEKKTEGYKVTIDKIIKKKKDGDYDLVVYADYKDPKPDEIVPQVITYPTAIVVTELDKLPERIYLKTNYQE